MRLVVACFLAMALVPAARAETAIAPDSVAISPSDTAAQVSESVAPVATGFPVFLGGKKLFVVRVARAGVPPAERAAAIRARLDEAVKQFEGARADSIWMRRTPEGVEVYDRGLRLFVVTHGDVEGMSVPELAQYAASLPEQLKQGILKERASRSPMGLAIAIALALGFTLLALILAKLLVEGGKRWRRFLDRFLPKHLPVFRLGNLQVLTAGQLAQILIAVIGRLDLILGVLLLYAYLTAVFSLFTWSQAWSWWLVSFAQGEVVQALIAIREAIPGLLVIATIFFLFRWLTKTSDRFFDAIEAGKVSVEWIHPEVAKPTKRLVKIGLWVIALAIAYPYIPGSSSKAVQNISILLGLMLSLGSTGIVGNAIAGIVLTYSRSFKVGDRVRIGDNVGDIVGLGFFATKLRTPRNEEVTLPNGQMANQAIVNYSRMAREAGLILHTQVTIGYDVDWRKVHALLIEAAARVEGVEREPAPWVFQRSLNDCHVTYEICCVTRRSHEQLALYSHLHQEIQDAFARAGVEILSPTYNQLRDANAPVLPSEPAGPRREPGGFRIRPPA